MGGEGVEFLAEWGAAVGVGRLIILIGWGFLRGEDDVSLFCGVLTFLSDSLVMMGVAWAEYLVGEPGVVVDLVVGDRTGSERGENLHLAMPSPFLLLAVGADLESEKYRVVSKLILLVNLKKLKTEKYSHTSTLNNAWLTETLLYALYTIYICNVHYFVRVTNKSGQ